VGANLLLWVLDFGSQTASSAWASALEYLSAFRHYDDFTRGVIDTSNVIFYLSFIFLGVFLTIRSVDSMRWRRAWNWLRRAALLQLGRPVGLCTGLKVQLGL